MALCCGGAANTQEAPSLEFYDLVVSAAADEFELCDTRGPLNELSSMTALAIKPLHSLSFKVRAVDANGDSVQGFMASLPSPLSDFTTVTFEDLQTTAIFEILPPVGINSEALCEQVGEISLWARDSSSSQLMVTKDIPVFVKCDCPDLQVELNDPPLQVNLQEPIRISARILCYDYNAGPFTVSMWLEDHEGRWVASRWMSFNNLAVGEVAPIPQIMYTPEEAGQYCLYVNIITDYEITYENNLVQHCLLVASGPFVVQPNVATPNGDGINDIIYFRFANQSLAQPRIRIFSLGGELIFETDETDSDRRLAWDGRDRDYRPVPAGSYLYVVYDGNTKFRTGMCGVVR